MLEINETHKSKAQVQTRIKLRGPNAAFGLTQFTPGIYELVIWDEDGSEVKVNVNDSHLALIRNAIDALL